MKTRNRNTCREQRYGYQVGEGEHGMNWEIGTDIYMLKVKVEVTQSDLTLCDPMDYTVHEILQARILEWVAVPFSSGSSRPRYRTGVSHITAGFFSN